MSENVVERTDAERIAELEATVRALSANQRPVQDGGVPEHGAGLGSTVAETWSQYEQEMARYGVHPDQQGE